LVNKVLVSEEGHLNFRVWMYKIIKMDN
jgi:hypothetical protein